MSNTGLFSSSVGRKMVMALTGLFLITFLTVHLAVNLTLFGGEEMFNDAAHFMGTNPLIQASQFLLAAGFIFHIGYGIKLELQNRAARGTKYAMNKPAENSTLNSRSMIVTGILVMLFLILHIKDYFVPMKFTNVEESHYKIVTTLFQNPLYVGLYVLAFVMLAVHLNHGFQSSFQSMGWNHPKYTPFVKGLSKVFCWIIGLGFSSIAIYFGFIA